MPVSNAQIAELFALGAEQQEGHLSRAYRRASRKALTWPVQAATLVDEGRPLRELAGIGPYLERVLSPWITDDIDAPDPPPLRRGFLTLADARMILEREGAPPINGDLQMHTTDSDGGSTLEQMADAAIARGYAFIAITDHSAGLRIVEGLDDPSLLRQGRRISALNARIAQNGHRLRILRSVEMNLSPTGEGDVALDTLAQLDIVLGSFHSQLRKVDDQTERYLAALRHPGLHVLAHPRGRIYNFRLGLSADWPRVFDAAAEADKAVEIDAYPDRQDLDVELLRIAATSGVRISIGTDAHAVSQLEWIDLGLAAALEAGVARDRILNLMEAEALLAWTDGLRSAAA